VTPLESVEKYSVLVAVLVLYVLTATPLLNVAENCEAE